MAPGINSLSLSYYQVKLNWRLEIFHPSCSLMPPFVIVGWTPLLPIKGLDKELGWEPQGSQNLRVKSGPSHGQRSYSLVCLCTTKREVWGGSPQSNLYQWYIESILGCWNKLGGRGEGTCSLLPCGQMKNVVEQPFLHDAPQTQASRGSLQGFHSEICLGNTSLLWMIQNAHY